MLQKLPLIFISHSSRDKVKYANPIVEIVGRDQCIVDAYDFEPAYKTWEEVVRNISRSSIFVFLASRKSLESDWCQNEVAKAKRAFELGEIRMFLVYIIEDGLTHRDLPDWMSKEECFNMKYFRSPVIIARDISQKLRSLIWSQNSGSEGTFNYFWGRNREIEEFQIKKAHRSHAKAMIVSGRTGSGRKCFARRCMLDLKMEKYSVPERLNLTRDDRIEDVITQLNAVTFLYSDERLNDILVSDEKVKVKCAVEQICEVSRFGYILIEDDRSVVEGGGHISDWFERILHHNDLLKQLRTFVISSIKLRAYDESRLSQELIYINFPVMSFEDRMVLLSKFIEEYNGQPLSEEQAKEIVKRLVYSPSQLMDIARIIAEHGYREAMRSLGAMENAGKRKVASLVKDFEEDNVVISLLLILAELESCSYDDLKAIFGDKFAEAENRIPELTDRSLLSAFGPSESFLRIDSAVAKYIQQSGMKLNKELRANLDSYIRDFLGSEDKSITEDLTTYMFTAKKAFRDGRLPVEKLFMPSIALKSIIGLYYEADDTNGENYRKVVNLCTDLLDNGEKIHLNKEYREDVTYWLCLALAHLGEEKEFFEHVKTFSGNQLNFLLGFWFRNQHDFFKAKKYLEKVIKADKAVSKKKAQTEMVIVLTQLKDYPEAYKLAYDLYNTYPENTYYISVLFRVIVLWGKKEKEHLELLDELRESMSHLLLKDREQYLDAMNLYVSVKDQHIPRTEKYKLIKQLREKYPRKMINYLREAIEYSVKYLA